MMRHLPPARFGLGFTLPGPLLALETAESQYHSLGRWRLLLDIYRHGCSHYVRLCRQQNGPAPFERSASVLRYKGYVASARHW